MADIKMLLQNYGSENQEDEQDDDDYSKFYETSMLDHSNPDDLLTPLEKLRKYCSSENIFTRQMVARSIVETVQAINTQQECLALLEIVSKLSQDFEPSVRWQLVEQLPPCCMLMMDIKLVPDAISNYILPVMVKYLTDTNNQVRKLSQNALLQLMDQEILQPDDAEVQICPVLIKLTEPDSSDDFRTEAITLMTKTAHLLGGISTEKIFLKRFGELCSDSLFHVRKVCASNFGDISSVVAPETTETILLPLFSRLCEDGVWGVRKACAESFMAVSGACSRQVKYKTLSPLFVGLLCDKSRWVQMAAYQALGQFIATFADPGRTGFDVTEDGILYQCELQKPEIPSVIETDSFQSSSMSKPYDSKLLNNSPQIIDPQNDFNSFEFWRVPLPDISLNEFLACDIKANQSLATDNSLESSPEYLNAYVIIDSKSRDNVDNTMEYLPKDPSYDSFDKTDTIDSNHSNDNDYLKIFEGNFDEEDLFDSTIHNLSVNIEHIKKQNIVPSALLAHFISMTEPTKAQTIDGELSRHCAFTLPGVVLALGRENWNCVKDIYNLLSVDMQWKVRRTLAFSLHDLALILGQEISVNDLVPVFNGFLKDLDEVRIGVLKHLSNFIQVLPTSLQKDYLHIFSEFLNTDNSRNWRFRMELAQQLMGLVNLYTEAELGEFICPVALTLAADKVAEVRENAYELLCMLIRRLSGDLVLRKFTANIKELGSKTQHWVKRKSCSQIYLCFLRNCCYDPVNFTKDFLPNLLQLCGDNVPNVRLVASKALLAYRSTIYFQSLSKDDSVKHMVECTFETLSKDVDSDVRYFSSEIGFQSNDTIKLEQCFNECSLNEEGMNIFTSSSDQPNEDNLSDNKLSKSLPDHTLQTSDLLNSSNQDKDIRGSDYYNDLENDIHILKSLENSEKLEVNHQNCENGELGFISIDKRNCSEDNGLQNVTNSTNLNDNICIFDPDIRN
ncbi:serine/threonine-protein phosphatase 4 regulatory subunit 1 isoform X2 [Hydra vulgaris]|uniref:Serine/threonine-protein phosphatase 4 regulatory subunit 1 isoform X2 n=1 Tax=Hydra vulgaris TaxID=6087 RepID=A0ABM4DN34_HYDVU